LLKDERIEIVLASEVDGGRQSIDPIDPAERKKTEAKASSRFVRSSRWEVKDLHGERYPIKSIRSLGIY
jgi:hypothetical protein